MRPQYLFSVKLVFLVVVTVGFLSWDATSNHANAIDIDITMEQANQALADGRGSMEKAGESRTCGQYHESRGTCYSGGY